MLFINSNLASLLLLLLLLLGIIGCKSQEAPGAIYGTVVLQGSMDNSGTTVFLENTNISTETQPSGMFVIFNVPEGVYKVIAQKDGYITQSHSGVSVLHEQAVVDVDFDLISTTPPVIPSVYIKMTK